MVVKAKPLTMSCTDCRIGVVSIADVNPVPLMLLLLLLLLTLLLMSVALLNPMESELLRLAFVLLLTLEVVLALISPFAVLLEPAVLDTTELLEDVVFIGVTVSLTGMMVLTAVELLSVVELSDMTLLPVTVVSLAVVALTTVVIIGVLAVVSAIAMPALVVVSGDEASGPPADMTSGAVATSKTLLSGVKGD